MPRKKQNTNHEIENIKPADTHEIETIDTSVFDYIRANRTTNGVEFTVKPYLAPQDQLEFVRRIVDAVFTDSGYSAGYFDFAVNYATVATYTDIALPSTDTVVDNLSEVVYSSNLIEEIINRTNRAQLNNLIEAAKDQIAFRKDLIVSYSPADDMYASINSILDKVNAWLDENLDKLNFDEKTLSGIKDISGKFANIPDGDLAKEIVKQAKKGTSKSRNNVVDFLEKN
jgi:hypothetical protein